MKEILQIGIKNIKNVSDIVFVFRDINCFNLKSLVQIKIKVLMCIKFLKLLAI